MSLHELPLEQAWLIEYVYCEKRPTNDQEEFLITNFPGVPIMRCLSHHPPSFSSKQVVEEFNEKWKGKSKVYCIGAKLVESQREFEDIRRSRMLSS